MILNAETMKEYEDWLDESVGKEERDYLCREVPALYESLFMDFVESQIK